MVKTGRVVTAVILKMKQGFLVGLFFFLSTCNPFTAICLLLFMTELVLASHFWLTVNALNLLSSNTEPHHFNTTQI